MSAGHEGMSYSPVSVGGGVEIPRYIPLHRRIQGSAPGAVTVAADIALAALDGTFKFALHNSV